MLICGEIQKSENMALLVNQNRKQIDAIPRCGVDIRDPLAPVPDDPEFFVFVRRLIDEPARPGRVIVQRNDRALGRTKNVATQVRNLIGDLRKRLALFNRDPGFDPAPGRFVRQRGNRV